MVIKYNVTTYSVNSYIKHIFYGKMRGDKTMFKKKNKELGAEKLQLDKDDRQVDNYEIIIYVTNGEELKFETGWGRFSAEYMYGIVSYKERIIKSRTFSDNIHTYNTNQFIKIIHKHIGTRYVKSEIKNTLKKSNDWINKVWFKEDELE